MKLLQECVIELPKQDAEFRRMPMGQFISVFEYHFGEPLKQLMNVTDLKIHFVPGDVTTATLTFADDKAPQTWIVAGISERER